MSVYADQKIFSRQTFNFPRLNKGSWHKYQLFPTKAPFGREMLYICRLNYFSRDWPYILRPKFFSRQWLYFLATKFFWSAFLVANCVISCSDSLAQTDSFLAAKPLSFQTILHSLSSPPLSPSNLILYSLP